MSGISPAEAGRLVAIARESLAHGLRHGRALALDPAAEPEALRTCRASFVSWRAPDARLRGCVGSLEAARALALDVAENAFRAAFHDPRFEPVSAAEAATLALHVSILGAPERLVVASREELLSRLRVGRDGLILRQEARQATFLPEVWEELADASAFLRALEKKAGIASFGPGVEAFRYETTTIGDPAA